MNKESFMKMKSLMHLNDENNNNQKIIKKKKIVINEVHFLMSNTHATQLT